MSARYVNLAPLRHRLNVTPEENRMRVEQRVIKACFWVVVVLAATGWFYVGVR